MKNIVLLSLLLIGCKTIEEPKQQQPDLCATVYDPHLCLIIIDSNDFASHGSNRCVAIRNLQKILEEHNHNPLIVKKAQCGRVLN